MLKRYFQLCLISCISLPASLLLANFSNVSGAPVLPLNNHSLVAQRPVIKRFQPLPRSVCDRLRSKMASTLRTRVVLSTAAFEDYINQTKGTGCQLTATGTRRNFNSIDDISKSVTTMLTGEGWKVDNQYAADGPEDKSIGFRKGNSLAILTINSTLAKSVKCDNNAPVATCYEGVKPEQILYKILLKTARQ